MEGPRGTKKEEFETVMTLINSIFRPDKQSMLQEYSIVYNEENLENIRIIVEDGKAVSHIGTIERDISIHYCKSRTGFIGGVCTDPSYRGRGYATIILNDCMNRFEKNGCDFMLISGGRGLYDKIDSLRVGQVHNITVTKGDLKRFKEVDTVSIEPYNENYLPQMFAAYDKKKVKFIRLKKDWEIGLKCGQVMNKPSNFFIVKNKDEFEGYLIISFAGEETSKTGNVLEYAGSTKSLIESIPLLFQQFNLQSLILNIPFEDQNFAKLIIDKGVNASVGPIAQMTVRILNFERLMNRLRPYFIKKIGRIARGMEFEEKNKKFSILLGKEKFTMQNRREMTWTVLGRPGSYPLLAKGGLEDLLKEIFPVPFVWYGLNYI